jgi:protein-S-isoprenylcysteine O-methyltransferase Ste14
MWLISLASSSITLVAFSNPIIALLLLCIGSFFCIAGVISFRNAKTTVNPLKPEQATSLVYSGIYQITRNPMYLGLAIILLAWAFFLGSFFSLIGVLAFILYITNFQILPEERAMQKLFSKDYSEYKNQVRRWL